MKQLVLLLFTALFFSCGQQPDKKEQIILDRIEYVYSLKSFIEKNAWAEFNNEKFDVPLVYYTDSCCYVANPTAKFISFYKPLFISKNSGIKFYKTPLLDSIPFHMSVGITFGDSTADYNFKSPFMNCSSVEITRTAIPDVGSTEEWATMILHEYFHGFQFQHPAYLSYYEKNIVFVASQDSLKHIYRTNKWFQESISKENDALLTAISSTNKEEIRALIDSFFERRTQRRAQVKQLLGFDIKPVEETYETMEGTARYVEFSLYAEFATRRPGNELAQDTCFHAYKFFHNFRLEENQWLFMANRTTYFYATGFNMARLLDKLNIEYKTRLFKEGGLSLEQILQTYK